MQELIDAVKSLGWDTYEAACYAALVRHGTMKASDVAMYADIPATKIYSPLNRLAAQGYVRIVDTEPKWYRAQNPQAVVEDEREDFREKSQDVGTKLQEAWEVQAEREDSDETEAWVTRSQAGAQMELRDVLDSAEHSFHGIAGRLARAPRSIVRKLAERCEAGLNVRLVSGTQARNQLLRLKSAGADVRERGSVMRSAYYIADEQKVVANLGTGRTTVVIRDEDTVNLVQRELDRVYDEAAEVTEDA